MRQCRAAQLQLGQGPSVSPATGQNPFVFRLMNLGAEPCWLKGYPSVALLDPHGRPLPFQITHRGDQMVTPAAPRVVRLRPHRSAFFVFNKYRCDRGFGISRLVRQVRIGLRAPPKSTRITRILPRLPQIGYCGRGDAGSTVAVSPIAGTLAGGLRH